MPAGPAKLNQEEVLGVNMTPLLLLVLHSGFF